MLLELISLAGLSAVSILVLALIYTALRNYRAHQFFKHKNPTLPLAPNQNLFFGGADLIFGKRNWLQLDENHKKLGKTYGFFYIHEPFVSTTDLDLIKQMTLEKPDEHLDRFSYHVPIKELEEDDIVSCRADQWKRMRKAFAPAITSYRFKSAHVKAELDEVLDKFIESIEFKLEAAKAEIGRPEIVQDVNDIFHRFSLEVVFTCFYKQKGTINFYDEDNYWIKSLDNTARSMIQPIIKVAVLLKPLHPIFAFLLDHFHASRHMRREIMDSIKRMTKISLEARSENKAAKGADKVRFADGTKLNRNLMDSVIDQYYSGKLTHTEYYHTMIFLFFASSRTNAEVMSKTIYLLAANESIQDKLRESLKLEGTESQYLSWVMNETMRLFPPIHGGCSRILASDMLCEAGLIPAGTAVVTPVYTIHRLKQYWGQDAEQFRPERWADSKRFHLAQFLPFGLGPRNCPGKDLALSEIKLLLNALLGRYKFELAPNTGDPKAFDAPGLIFVICDGPMNIKISRLSRS